MTGFARHWGRGPDPALLLHCSLAHSGAWEGVARILGDRLTMTAPDLVGHGKGPAGDPHRDYHDHCTEQAASFLPDGPCHLIGHSFGATVALRLAIERADRVASLTLIEPVLFAAARGSAGWRAHNAALDGLGPAFAARDWAKATRLFIGVWGDGPPLDALPAKQQAYLTERIWVIAASNAALHDDTARLLPRLGQVNCPVQLIEGSASPPVIGEIQTALALHLPRARRSTIAGAGHMLPITHPAEVAEAIRQGLV